MKTQIFNRNAHGAFSNRARRLGANSVLFVIPGASGPVIYFRSLDSGRSERLLSRRRSREVEIFERDGEIERDEKGKYETSRPIFGSSIPSFLPSSLVCVCYNICQLLFDSIPFGFCMKAHRTDITIV